MACDKRISLDPRLTMIAEMVGSCGCCADIGSDHGRLGAFLLQNNYCKRVVFTDISVPSLEKARKLVALLGLNDRADFRVGDGARALDLPVDAAIIAGMGGETMAGIIANADGHLRGARLLLEPNVAVPQLREALCDSGWRITRETFVRDGRRIYPIIEAVEGQMHLSETELEVGPVFLKEQPSLLRDYAAFRIRVTEKALAGARHGVDAENVRLLSRSLDIWKEVEKCL